MQTHAQALKALAGLCLLMAAAQGHAGCDPISSASDAADVAAGREAVAASCDCAGAPTHGTYVSCAAAQAKATPMNNVSCRGVVNRCEARSTCGKPGFVTCCRTYPNGRSRCTVKRDTAACDPPENGTASVGTGSCCDTCGCGNGIEEPGEQCDSNFCRGGCNPLTGICVDIGCNPDCTCPAPRCGDFVVDPGEQCDPPGSPCADGQSCLSDCSCPPPP